MRVHLFAMLLGSVFIGALIAIAAVPGVREVCLVGLVLAAVYSAGRAGLAYFFNIF